MYISIILGLFLILVFIVLQAVEMSSRVESPGLDLNQDQVFCLLDII